MSRPLVLLATLIACCGGAQASETSWIFRPSTYTHHPETAERVAQYAPENPAYKIEDPTYQQSAYRHSRSSLRVGDTYDNLHIVETWGRGEYIRPYGEWLYPYRAGATPYGPWGNPQGPWTTPFGAWSNPYGLGRLPNLQWSPWYPGTVAPPGMALPTPSAALPSVPGSTVGPYRMPGAVMGPADGAEF